MLFSAMSTRRLSCFSSTSRAMQLDGVVLEHLDGARDLADLVAVLARGDRDRGVVTRELDHRLGDPARGGTARGAWWPSPIGPISTIATSALSSTQAISDFAVALTKSTACCASRVRRLRCCLIRSSTPFGDMGVVVGLLDRLILREFVGIEVDLTGRLEQSRQAVADALLQRNGFAPLVLVGGLLLADLLHQRQKFKPDLHRGRGRSA